LKDIEAETVSQADPLPYASESAELIFGYFSIAWRRPWRPCHTRRRSLKLTCCSLLGSSEGWYLCFGDEACGAPELRVAADFPLSWSNALGLLWMFARDVVIAGWIDEKDIRGDREGASVDLGCDVAIGVVSGGESDNII
jgi:hypothetical protein